MTKCAGRYSSPNIEHILNENQPISSAEKFKPPVKYYVHVSDGLNFYKFAILKLDTKHENNIENNPAFNKFCIIQVRRHQLASMDKSLDKKILVITEYDILESGSKKIGNPSKIGQKIGNPSKIDANGTLAMEEEETQSLTAMANREDLIRPLSAWISLRVKCEFLENRMKNFQEKIVPSLNEKCRSLALEIRNSIEKGDSGTRVDLVRLDELKLENEFFKETSLQISEFLKEERIRSDELSKLNRDFKEKLSNADKIHKDEINELISVNANKIKELKLENEKLKDLNTRLAKEKTEKEQKGRNR